ncbi:universal stress protein [Streptococcus zalophi]|uniref:Universal stress protein n=1 Tax=Streptococcus zalophi TaxID=640031 RepID=A0A934PAK3_9STRE|nr:universal stress protein [Streptococcus zalophi]MBJ8350157.1 universal stress protein [Streptococcus zalophi]MCR8968197.1 universal stress protein [Streptococcus zalophi]
MTYQYKRILVGIDGSPQAEIALKKGIQIAINDKAELILAHVIDTRATQSVATLDGFVFEQLENEANRILKKYKELAQEKGLENVKSIIEFGNPKTLLATDIPEKENVDLIMLGATGLSTFERLLIGSSSEYIMRHAAVDILIVRK